MLKKLLALTFASGILLTACTGNDTTNNGGNTPVVQSSLGVVIDPMSSVPVLNGTATQGTLYIHNYTNKTVSGVNFNLNQSTFTSQVKSLVAKAGLNLGSIEDKSGFVLLNSEGCNIIAANSSCAINFVTPNLSFGNQGSSLVSINYKLDNKPVTNSQIVNYNYIDTNSTTGVDFTGSLDVNQTIGNTKYVVAYLYAGGQLDDVYKNVNLISSSASVNINGGFINGQEVATSQVIAVELAVSVQNNHKVYVNVVPTWGQSTSSVSRSDVSSGNGLPLNIALDPEKNVANYLFGNVPILTAASGRTSTIQVVNNGNGDGTLLTATKTGGQADGISVNTSDCTANKLQANTNGTCNIVYTVNTYTPGSTTVDYKNASGTVVGSQIIYWTNEKPVPVIKVTRSTNSLTFAKGSSSGNTVRFTMLNVGNAPLESFSRAPSITGVSTVATSSTSCLVSLGINQSCYIDVTLTNATSGIGMLYLRALGQYNGVQYSFASLPVSYTVTNTASISITPTETVILNASPGSLATQTFFVQANMGSEPATITSLSLGFMSTHPQPQITGGSCSVGTILTSGGANCTVVVQFSGTLSDESSANGTTNLRIEYTGGFPYTNVYQATSSTIAYNFSGNDSGLTVTSTASNMTGTGLVNSPYSGREVSNDIKISLTYRNKSTNYGMTHFNINTNNLPYGLVVGSGGDCPTQEQVGGLSPGGSCTLPLTVNKSLLKISPQGGSVVLNFTTPPASWQTTLGLYNESFSTVIYANYLQPSISFSFSQNNTSFESTILTMTLANESAGTMPVNIGVSQVKAWLVNSPVSSTCSISGGDYSASCNLGGANGKTAQISYIMPNYFNLGESANIPLVYTTTNNIFLGTGYSFINYIYLILWTNVGKAGFTPGTANNTSFAIDKFGTQYIAFADGNSGNKLSVMKFNGESWVYVGNPGISNFDVGGISLAINESGTPYVAYIDNGNLSTPRVVGFNGTNWYDISGGPLTDNSSFSINLAIDKSGVPYVAFGETYFGSSKVTVMKLSNGWTNVGGSVRDGYSINSITLAINESGTPYVAYIDEGAIKVSKFNASWSNVGSITGTPSETVDLAISRDGIPYIVYSDADNNYKATVQQFDEIDGWDILGAAGFSSEISGYPQLAIDSLGTPYVAYQASADSKANVMKFDSNNNNWVDVGMPGFSAGPANFLNIAINRLNIPYVAYGDGSNGNKATVMQYK